MITLCSVHKAKGLEWNRVYILGRDSLMPSKFARQKWQMDQELNLIYVAVTRAKAELIEATAPPSNGKRNHERSLENV
jgi:superfamily I DNA/RNA helicase